MDPLLDAQVPGGAVTALLCCCLLSALTLEPPFGVVHCHPCSLCSHSIPTQMQHPHIVVLAPVQPGIPPMVTSAQAKALNLAAGRTGLSAHLKLARPCILRYAGDLAARLGCTRWPCAACAAPAGVQVGTHHLYPYAPFLYVVGTVLARRRSALATVLLALGSTSAG